MVYYTVLTSEGEKINKKIKGEVGEMLSSGVVFFDCLLLDGVFFSPS